MLKQKILDGPREQTVNKERRKSSRSVSRSRMSHPESRISDLSQHEPKEIKFVRKYIIVFLFEMRHIRLSFSFILVILNQ